MAEWAIIAEGADMREREIDAGGSRMVRHGAAYSRHLDRFLPRRNLRIVVAEIGIANGGGLALWSKLFPNARLIGLDSDLSRFRDNEAFLRSKGAFATGTVEVHAFDHDSLATILGADKISIIVDDGLRSFERTARSMTPFLADAFTYFVESNAATLDVLSAQFPDCRVSSHGELTVIEREAHH